MVWLSLALAACGGSSKKTVSDGEAGDSTLGGSGGRSHLRDALILTIRYYTDGRCAGDLQEQPPVTFEVEIRQ